MHLFGLDLEAPLQHTNLKVASPESVVNTSASGYSSKPVMYEATFDGKLDMLLLGNCVFPMCHQEIGGAYAIAFARAR